MKLILVLFSLIYFTPIFSQNTVKYEYYKDIECTLISNERKAKFVVSHKLISDSVKVVQMETAKSQTIIWTRKYKNDKPYGIWLTYNKNGKLVSKETYGCIKHEDILVLDLVTNNLKEVYKEDFEYPMFKLLNKGEMTLFPFNLENISKWIGYNVKYPLEAQIQGIQGIVWVQFIVDCQGNVLNLDITHGVHKLLDDEVLRLMQTLPDLKPGTLKRKNIALYLEIPVSFSLEIAD